MILFLAVRLFYFLGKELVCTLCEWEFLKVCMKIAASFIINWEEKKQTERPSLC